MSPPFIEEPVQWKTSTARGRGWIRASANEFILRTVEGTEYSGSITGWPWYGFGAAFRASIANETITITFVPSGASLTTWYEGIAASRRFHAAITGKPMPLKGPLGARIFVAVVGVLRVFFMLCSALLAAGVALDTSVPPAFRALTGIMALALAAMIFMSLTSRLTK